MAKITAMEEKRKQLHMNKTQFYAAPKTPASNSKLPIFDAKHTRNAMARFNQTRFRSKTEKLTAYRKIIRKANKFSIDVDEFKKRKPRS